MSSPYRDLAFAQGLIALVSLLLIPLSSALAPGVHRLEGVLHGLGATLTLLLATYTWHAYYGYAKGNDAVRPTLERRLWMTNVLILATLIAGNWLYIGYQAPEGAAEWFKLHAPAGHWVIMEYKEFVSLLAFPPGIAASVLLRRFAACASTSWHIRSVIGLLLTMMWFCLFVGFSFGLVLAKWKLA
ncbi:hypothetical protein CBW46_006810 [Paenibacillus xerothermodurans]|uniref:Uncharacterized protein n=1 Tax=Paenibacillus xerothermodurans TaxID=1977292 RepID=A0A2W1NU90_PAEXE|nr:hypothetical protein CBW46_006810 [Paenibacillus xerothermodurans]